MIQDQSHLWQQFPPLPIVNQPLNDRNVAKCEAIEPAARRPDAPLPPATQTLDSREDVPEEYQWLSLL
jgi:hypothetical protein